MNDKKIHSAEGWVNCSGTRQTQHLKYEDRVDFRNSTFCLCSHLIPPHNPEEEEEHLTYK